MPETPTVEVPAEAAYAAATERALKTTHALILAEAQVIQAKEESRLLRGELSIYRKELEETKKMMQRRVDTLRRRAEAAEGVTHDGQNDEERSADTCCAARSPHDFSD